MVSTGNEQYSDSIQAEPGSVKTPNSKDQIPLYNTTTSQRGLLIDINNTTDQLNPRKRYLDFLTSLPIRAGFRKLGSGRRLSSPSAKFRRIAEERDEISRSVCCPTRQKSREGLSVPFVGKVNWGFVRNICKNWIRNPMNMALLVWIVCVAISGAILFLVMTGMLDHALPRKSQRDAWFEVNNQILNALFTLMCLYQHPKRFYHFVLLCRWRPDDVLRLRKIYCKNGTYKPHEWTHMMVVIVLLHVNCFAQYASCGLNWGYKRSERPPIGVGLCVAVAIAAPAIAGIYSILSPLGKEYDSGMDQEAQITTTIDTSKPTGINVVKSFEKRYSFVSRDNQRLMESNPEWKGGLSDLWDDISLAYLSMFCSFCVFGWNMERLGFGNMYVHIATFLLLCMAPFWIFNLAAININNEVIREALGITGIVLCVFGLLYGGFWRIQMRKRFNLPANDFCCGYPAVTDCMQWLFCCACSLAQEVRTGDFYAIETDGFYRKQTNGEVQPNLSPLPREDGSPLFRSSPSSPLWSHSSPSKFRMESLQSPSRLTKGSNINEKLPVLEELPTLVKGDIMTPPASLSIQRED